MSEITAKLTTALADRYRIERRVGGGCIEFRASRTY